jgi:hypothetical protein
MVRAALEHTLTHHDPYPALVTDSAYNLVMVNSGLRRLLRWLAGDETLLERYGNVYRLMFAPDGLRPYVQGWQAISRVLLKRLHDESLAYQNPALAQLHAECAALSEGQPPPDLFTANTPTLTLTLCGDGQAVSLFSTVTTFGTAIDVTLQELRIESFYPADRASERVLRGL